MPTGQLFDALVAHFYEGFVLANPNPLGLGRSTLLWMSSWLSPFRGLKPAVKLQIHSVFLSKSWDHNLNIWELDCALRKWKPTNCRTSPANVSRLCGGPPAAASIEEAVPHVSDLSRQSVTEKGMDLLMSFGIFIAIRSLHCESSCHICFKFNALEVTLYLL